MECGCECSSTGNVYPENGFSIVGTSSIRANIFLFCIELYMHENNFCFCFTFKHKLVVRHFFFNVLMDFKKKINRICLNFFFYKMINVLLFECARDNIIYVCCPIVFLLVCLLLYHNMASVFLRLNMGSFLIILYIYKTKTNFYRKDDTNCCI